ncbi:hypothetical protein [Botrimarina sp.]|uniref:hypothetical protein n=1 Tax=Botrimarina sp. TaxID=2795802 RepID=UPI0032EE4ABF
MSFTHRSRALTAAIAVIALSAASAHASISTQPSVILDGDGTVSASSSGSVTFNWIETPFAAYLEFTVTNPFDLFLDSFMVGSTASTGPNDISAVILDQLDGMGGSTRLTTDTNVANSAPGVLAGQANMFGEPGTVRSEGVVYNADSATPLLAGLAPGTYRLGVYDNGTPSMATAGFRIDESLAAVPEAASSLVWIAGLVLAGGATRRGC